MTPLIFILMNFPLYVLGGYEISNCVSWMADYIVR
jgi:hypothetical protein